MKSTRKITIAKEDSPVDIKKAIASMPDDGVTMTFSASMVGQGYGERFETRSVSFEWEE